MCDPSICVTVCVYDSCTLCRTLYFLVCVWVRAWLWLCGCVFDSIFCDPVFMYLGNYNWVCDSVCVKSAVGHACGWLKMWVKLWLCVSGVVSMALYMCNSPDDWTFCGCLWLILYVCHTWVYVTHNVPATLGVWLLYMKSVTLCLRDWGCVMALWLVCLYDSGRVFIAMSICVTSVA